MSYQFYEDFSFYDEKNKPYNISIERNSDLEHDHATVIDNNYQILVVGNKHFAKTPPLKNINLALNLDIHTPDFEVESRFHNYGFRLYFRYDRFLKEGYLLEGTLSKTNFNVKLIAIDRNHNSTVLQEHDAAASETFDHSDFNVTLATRENNITLAVDDVEFAMTDDKYMFTEAGHIGLDMNFYPGDLIVKEMFVKSSDKLEKSTLIEPLNIELPKIHGMSVPYQYALQLARYENGPCELTIQLSGGIKDRPDRGKCGKQWTHEIDQLENPYVRIDSLTGECVNILLFHGLKTLIDKEESRPFVLETYKQVDWPLVRTVYFDSLPDITTLTFATGYDYFFNEPLSFLEGGPFEVICDSQGQILYTGQSIRKGNVAVSITSPEDKSICSLIPENIPDREKALQHARHNHYFFENEKISFMIDIRYHSDLYFPEEFIITAELQDVFGNPWDSNIKLIPRNQTDNHLTQLGIDTLMYKAECDKKLLTGVYHLNLKVSCSADTVYHKNTVFEVMSIREDAISPPLASGLPALFSIPNEIKYMQTDAFDPYYETSGAMHYFSINCFYPDYARDNRIWELLSLYKRKWFSVINARNTPNDTSIDKNKDLIAHCDYLQIPLENKPRHGRYELWKEDIYKEDILDVLIDFIKANPAISEQFEHISLQKLTDVQTANECLPKKMFIELVDRCWNEWTAFFSDFYATTLTKQKDKLSKINPFVKTVTGGPFSIYASHNKMAYFLNNFGHNICGKTQQFYNGFWQFEDYAHSCGYSFTKAPFAMMTIKMHYPVWKLFPEIYSSLLLDGCNDGAVAQAHPPYGYYEMPVALMRERIYEYAFATVWFKDGKFNYWQDNGFHLRCPNKGFMNELLRAWGNVRKHKPVCPVKTTCFLADVDLIAEHPDHYEENCNIHAPWKDVINPAEEALVYSYNAARNTGIPAGFSTRLEDLKSLTPDMTDLIILPPLSKNTPQEYIDTIRERHQQGINLLGFENVYGLEDLFGVKTLESTVDIQEISVDAEYTSNIGQLDAEYTEHKLCKAYYQNVDGDVILKANKASDIPALVTKQTTWGRTALFNVPPTVVKRDSFIERIGYGQECVSTIMKHASEYIIKELSKPVVSVNSPNAKLISFYDEHGNLIIVVEQESLAVPDLVNYPQTFLVTVNIGNIADDAVSCDEAFSIASVNENRTILRVRLGKYESAIFKLQITKNLNIEP